MEGNNLSKDLLLDGDHQLIAAANFAIAKSLARLNVFEEEIKILEHELRGLEQEIKIQKVNRFISKQSS